MPACLCTQGGVMLPFLRFLCVSLPTLCSRRLTACLCKPPVFRTHNPKQTKAPTMSWRCRWLEAVHKTVLRSCQGRAGKEKNKLTYFFSPLFLLSFFVTQPLIPHPI